MQRDGECRLVIALRTREITRVDVPLPKEGLSIDWDVVDVYTNIFLDQ